MLNVLFAQHRQRNIAGRSGTILRSRPQIQTRNNVCTPESTINGSVKNRTNLGLETTNCG